MLLDIGEVSKRSGFRPSTLRYYEERGLVESITRHGLRRQFEPEVIIRLSLIGLGQLAGFSLDEIALMLGKNGRPAISRQKLLKRAQDIEQQIKRLTTLRKALEHVAGCKAPSHLECPKFRRLMRHARSGREG